jgi:hypothetical protein
MLGQILKGNVNVDKMGNYTVILMSLKGVELLLKYWNIANVSVLGKSGVWYMRTGHKVP